MSHIWLESDFEKGWVKEEEKIRNEGGDESDGR